ncbi:MAG: Rho termination factor N-terminal domain-containing protein [Solirubrobacterales bacterium]
MNKTELESKHIAELHALAAEAGVPRYRMLRREELVEKLSDGKAGESAHPRGGEKPSQQRERPQRRRRERSGGERPPGERQERPAKDRERPAQERARPAKDEAPQPAAAAAEPESSAADQPGSAPPKRKRRRRRFGRRSKALRAKDLLSPPPGRQALVYGESRAACTGLLRELASELSDAVDGPDPIALLIDPSPEELADWKREAPQAELVVAAQARHASDALAQATRRAESGEDITLLVDSLTRLEDAEIAKEIFDSGLGKTKGSLTVVAALERAS